MKIIVFLTIVLVMFQYLKADACAPNRQKDYICHAGRHRASLKSKKCVTACKENGVISCSEAEDLLQDLMYNKAEDSSESTNNEEQANVNSSLLNCGDGVTAVSTYIIYIIGFIMLLMLVAIVCLGYLVYRNQLCEYKVFASPASPCTTVNTDIRRYITQSSQEMSLLNINPMSESKQQTFKESKSRNDILSNNGKDNDFIESIPQQNALKIYKSVKKPVDHKVLLREQMKKICEDALAKSQNCGITASLKDLNQLLNDVDHEKREKSHENIVREKSASFPQLDIYDAPPARHIPVNENEVDLPVYECLPTSNNIVVEDYDTMYLMTLSEDKLAEPSYINAKNRYN